MEVLYGYHIYCYLQRLCILQAINCSTQIGIQDILLLLLFILTANGFLPGGSGYTIRYNKQITHITQNNTTIKRNTAHKTTHTINMPEDK
jgi:hypothetical protein